MSNNDNLNNAKHAKYDEFYTKLSDIESELTYYKEHFKGKIIYCNCDNPYESNFVRYFLMNFKALGLKKVITSNYDENQEITLFNLNDTDTNSSAYSLRAESEPDLSNYYDYIKKSSKELKYSGDFRSPECIELLKEADIVVTNPPFSLMTPFIYQMVKHKKQFLIVGPMNAITYEEIFPLIRSNQLWLGYNHIKSFITPDGEKTFGNVIWYTNLDIDKRHKDLPLTRTFNSEDYQTYDNFNAIEVGKLKDIPKDYEGIMGVPITFLEHHNPEQFDIVGCSYSYGLPEGWSPNTNMTVSINGQEIYKRILIKKH